MAISAKQTQPAYVTADNISSTNITFGSACTPGTKLVGMMTGEERLNTYTMSDTTHGSWTKDVEGNDNVSFHYAHCAIFSMDNTASSALTVTVSWGGAAHGFAKIYELTASGSITLDKTGTDVDINNAISVSLTSCAANDFIVACNAGYGSVEPNAADSGFTLDIPAVGFYNSYHIGERIYDSGAAGTKTIVFQGSVTQNQYTATVAAAYKEVVSAAPPAPTDYQDLIITS